MVDNQKEDVLEPVLEKAELWVKLKIPNYEEEEEKSKEAMNEEKRVRDEGIKHKNRNDMKRVCHVCKREFSSGKALGGHMRIHVQEENKDPIFKKKLLKAHQPIKFKKRNPREERVVDFVKMKKTKHSYGGGGGGGSSGDDGDDDAIRTPTCAVCGKDFPSMKSLFGHMRCHPDRQWRGTQPPVKVRNCYSYSSSLSDEEKGVNLAADEKSKGVNLTESLKGTWPAKARRGRRSTTATASTSELSRTEEEDDDDRFKNAVNDLLMFAQGAASFENSFCKSKTLDIDPEISKSKKQKMDQSSSVLDEKEEKGSNEVEKSAFLGSGLGQGESVNKQDFNVQEIDQYCSSDEIMGSHELMNTVNNDRDYENLQKIKNNKRKIRKKVKLCDLDQNVITSTPSPDHKYKCNTCEKCFLSHQALGGHRSSHNKFKIVIQNSIGDIHQETGPSSNRVDRTRSKNFSKTELEKRCDNGIEAEESHVEDSQTCRRVLDFDLNEVPPLEDDQENGVFDSDLNFRSW